MSNQEDSTYTYRIAVFGRMKSGKTAYLASAATASISASSGGGIKFSETTRPLVRNEHELNAKFAKSEGRKSKKELITKYIESQRQIFSQDFKDSVERMNRHRSPVATEKHDYLIPVHKFGVTSNRKDGDKEGRGAFIEIIDYSGEFLDPTQDLEIAAAELRKILRQMDGFLIFAETIGENASSESHGKIAEEINALAGAFSRLFSEDNNAQKLYGRACILVNKWDRVEEFDFTNLRPEALKPLVEEQQDKLRDWLRSSNGAVAHQQLYNGLLDDLGPENVAIFPVSAFGRSQQGTDDDGGNVEVPAVIPLPYLNVVEPIEKLIDIADEADLRLAEQVAKNRNGILSRMAFWKILDKQQGELSPNILEQRMRYSVSRSKRIKKIRELNQSAFLWRSGTAMVIAYALAITVQSGIDLQAEGHIALCQESPTADCTYQSVQKLDQFIAADTLPLRPVSKTLILGNAENRRSELKAESDTIWQKLLFENIDPRERTTVENARHYQTLYPAGGTDFSERATDILNFSRSYSDVQSWLEDNSTNFEEIETAVKVCLSGEVDLPQLTNLLEDTSANMPGDIVVGDFGDAWAETLKKLEDKKSLLAEGRKCQQEQGFAVLTEKLQTSLGALDELRALQLLNQAMGAYNVTTISPDRLTNLARSTYEAVLLQANNQYPGRSDSYRDWNAKYENLMAILREFENGENYSILSELMKQYRPQFNSLKTRYRETWDCTHREQVLDDLPRTQAELVRSTGAVRDEMQKYADAPHTKNFTGDMRLIEEYIDQFDRPQTLEITAQCVDLNGGHDRRTEVEIQANGVQFSNSSFDYDGHETCGVGAISRVQVTGNDNVDFSGRIYNSGDPWSPIINERIYVVKEGANYSVEQLLDGLTRIDVSHKGSTGTITLKSELTTIAPLQGLSQGCKIE